MNSILLQSENGDEIIIIPNEVIGRDGQCSELFQNSEHISRVHSIFTYKQSCCYLEDLASTNGTFVNSVRLTPYKPIEVFINDTISFSSKFKFKIIRLN